MERVNDAKSRRQLAIVLVAFAFAGMFSSMNSRATAGMMSLAECAPKIEQTLEYDQSQGGYVSRGVTLERSPECTGTWKVRLVGQHGELLAQGTVEDGAPGVQWPGVPVSLVENVYAERGR